MSPSRKPKREKSTRKPRSERGDAAAHPAADDKGFQDRVMGLVEWLAAHDPVKAARLIGDYLDDLADELGPSAPKPAKG